MTSKMSVEEALERLREEPKPEDIDLVDEVRQILKENTLGKLADENYDTHRYIKDAAGKRPEIQRHFLNKFWGLQLVSAEDNSIEERSCLIPDGDVKDWLTLFRSNVVPFLIKNQLPKQF